MFELIGTVDRCDIEEIFGDCIGRFNETLNSIAELVAVDGTKYYRLLDGERVIAVYDDEDQYVPREVVPELY